MKLVPPLYDKSGRRLPKALFSNRREHIVERFWETDRALAISWLRDLGGGSEQGVKREELVIFEVMIRLVDRKWWMDYRYRLEK